MGQEKNSNHLDRHLVRLLIVVGMMATFFVVNASSQRAAHAWSFGTSPTQAFGLNAFVGNGNGAVRQDIVEDADGNFFISGWTAGTIDVDPSSGTKLLGDNTDYISFVAKYSPSGDLQWAYDWKASPGYLEIHDIAVGPGGYIILSGNTPSQDLNPTSGVDAVTSDANDAFLMRINADGSYGWGRVFPTSGSNISQALDIRVLSNGDIVTAISFEGTLTLPSGTITAAAGFDIVVVKTNADASSLIWRSSLQGSSTDWIDEVHVSTSGNVSLVGGFSSATTTLTSSDSSTTVLTRASGASSSAYAVSLTSAGVASYATVVGPTNSYSRSSTISSTGEVLVFVNTGDLIKVSTSGVASTVGSFGATVAAFGMAHLASGELAMGGEFSGTVDLDPSSGVASRTPTAIGSASFVARLSSTYSLTQLHVIDGNNSDSISSVAASASGGLLATGTGISASVNLSNTTHDGSFTRAAGTDSMAFVVRYDAAGTSGVPTTTTTTTTTVPPTSTLPLTSAPTTVSYKTSNKKITLSWTAVSGASTYVVRNASGSSVCTGAATSCVVSGLKNGKSYTYSVRSVNGAGVESATATSKTVIPGFTLKKTAFKKNAKPNFATIMTTPSRGIQKWTIRSGKCAVQGGRVVMPAKKGTCRITVSVGKKGSYAAMTTSLVVTAQ